MIFERKYPREQSEDLHSYPLPIVPTFIMKPDLENDRNVKNTKKTVSQEYNFLWNRKKFWTYNSDDKFWEFIIF